MRHRLSGLSTYGLKGQCAGDEHPTYAPLEHGPPLPPGFRQVTWMKMAATPGHCRRCICSSSSMTAQNRCPLHLEARDLRIAVRYGQWATALPTGRPSASTATTPATWRRLFIPHSSFVACLRPEIIGNRSHKYFFYLGRLTDVLLLFFANVFRK